MSNGKLCSTKDTPVANSLGNELFELFSQRLDQTPLAHHRQRFFHKVHTDAGDSDSAWNEMMRTTLHSIRGVRR